jgi:hypothetical protein
MSYSREESHRIGRDCGSYPCAICKERADNWAKAPVSKKAEYAVQKLLKDPVIQKFLKKYFPKKKRS